MTAEGKEGSELTIDTILSLQITPWGNDQEIPETVQGKLCPALSLVSQNEARG